MDVLEKETLKYEKKGFKVEQKRTLKYGSRTFLKRKGGFLGGFDGVYIYYVDGDATTDSLRECFKDYMKFYEAEEFGEGDKGFFLCSGSVDEKLFKDLRKAMIGNDDVRNSIKLLSLGKTAERETEAEQPKRRVQKSTIESSEILTKIKKFTIRKMPKSRKTSTACLSVTFLHSIQTFAREIRIRM
jgi:hypothetical protein